MTREREIYSRSPIVEAIVDIRCVPASDVRVLDLKRVGDSMAGYEMASELVEIQQTMTSDTRTETTRKVGFAYRCESRSIVAQLLLEGFACSKLAPYERWESLRNDARELFAKYSEAVSPTAVKRIAVRFINRIEMEQPISDFRPFVHVYPSTPWDLTSPPSGVFLQVKRELTAGRVLVLNEGVVQNDAGKVALVLDFDAFVEDERSFAAEAVWNEVEALHVSIHDAFESSITDAVRERIR